MVAPASYRLSPVQEPWGTSHETTGGVFLRDEDVHPGSVVEVRGRQHPAPREASRLLELFYGMERRKPDRAWDPAVDS
jgi:hypothetical protein